MYARGVKQGCPLSQILFNLAMKQLVSRLEEEGTGYHIEEQTVTVLAYTDDLCMIVNTNENLQKLIDKVQQFAEWVGL